MLSSYYRLKFNKQNTVILIKFKSDEKGCIFKALLYKKIPSTKPKQVKLRVYSENPKNKKSQAIFFRYH